MEILHNDQQWSTGAAARDQRRCHFALAAVTSGVVHGVIKRSPLACLRQVKQVMKKKRASQARPLLRRPNVRPHGVVSRLQRMASGRANSGAMRGSGPVLCQPRNRVQDCDAQRSPRPRRNVASPRPSGSPDARLAADVDDLTRPPTETRAKDTPELLQFGLARNRRRKKSPAERPIQAGHRELLDTSHWPTNRNAAVTASTKRPNTYGEGGAAEQQSRKFVLG
jgi:hypothetical protein